MEDGRRLQPPQSPTSRIQMADKACIRFLATSSDEDFDSIRHYDWSVYEQATTSFEDFVKITRFRVCLGIRV